MSLKKAFVLLWPFLPCWAMSAVLHATDSDVGGLGQVVSSRSLLLSSCVWAVPLAVGAYSGLVAHLGHGLLGFAAVAVPTASLLGFLIARLGSTATTGIGFMWSAVGSAVVLLVVLSVAALPAAAVVLTLRHAAEEHVDAHIDAVP